MMKPEFLALGRCFRVADRVAGARVWVKVAGTALVGTLIAVSWSTASQAENPAEVRRLLDAGRCPNCDLSNADLSGMNLEDTNLSGANLVEANLENANLQGADLRNAVLNGANLSGANLRFANLSNATLHGVRIRRPADFSGANLDGTVMPSGRTDQPAADTTGESSQPGNANPPSNQTPAVANSANQSAGSSAVYYSLPESDRSQTQPTNSSAPPTTPVTDSAPENGRRPSAPNGAPNENSNSYRLIHRSQPNVAPTRSGFHDWIHRAAPHAHPERRPSSTEADNPAATQPTAVETVIPSDTPTPARSTPSRESRRNGRDRTETNSATSNSQN